MATRANPFEGVSPQVPPPVESEPGPLAPRVMDKEVISSGPFKSPLQRVQGRQPEIPPGEDYLGQLARRLPGKHLDTAVAFLRSVEPEKAKQAASVLLRELKALGQRLDKLPNPKKILARCIEKAEEEIGRTVH